MKKNQLIGLSLLLFVGVYSCKKESVSTSSSGYYSSTPILPTIPFDYSDRSSFGNTSNDLITLGRVLFYDRNLSANGNMSCGTCHKQDKGFADNVQFHKGIAGNTLSRNTLSITGNSNELFWDGRASSLEELATLPIQNHKEMGMNVNELVKKINGLPYYKDLINKAWLTNEITPSMLSRSLAAFCRVLSAAPNSLADTLTYNTEEKLGFQVFHSSEAKCFACHKAITQDREGYFSISEPANIGLDSLSVDEGIKSITNEESDGGRFKVPNLRNVALTAPYMHDGRFKTLEEVIEHYNSGVVMNKNLSPFLYEGNLTFDKIIMNDQIFVSINQDSSMMTTSNQPQRLHLSEAKKRALVAFLKRLSDHSIASDARLSDPFKK